MSPEELDVVLRRLIVLGAPKASCFSLMHVSVVQLVLGIVYHSVWDA